jgi:flagellar biosynthesis protein FlhB
MAEDNDAEHTQDPTQKRLDEAINRGDVARSIEVNTWFMLAGGALVLMIFAGPTAQSLATSFRGILANSYQVPTDPAALGHFARGMAFRVIAALGIPFLLLVLAALCGSMVQHRILFTIDPITPRLSKISPAAGFGRLFSKDALANFAKGLVKLGVFGAVIFALLWPQQQKIRGLIAVDPAEILPFTQSLTMKMLGAVVAVLAVVAAADYFFQYRQWYDRQRMTVQEMKEEFRQTEGDPMIKGKIRQLRQARARKRMMAAVPKASIIITNPTHYAIALQYERGMNAPVCVAKGVDLIARKIREIAETHGIPVVENPPLARALHATVDIDQEIPPEHYRAVAEIIGYLMRLRRLVAR